MDLSLSVLHKYSYITPPQLARRIRRMRVVVCRPSRPYLDCCLEYNDLQSVCKKFADIYGDEDLADPHIFEERVLLHQNKNSAIHNNASPSSPSS